MDFEDFEDRARRAYEDIPEQYLEGIDGLIVRRDAPEHPTLPGVYTVGECLTETYDSEYGSPDTTRSMIALYWGSFREIARVDPDFDWDGEIWETLTHELRHHLESLAGDDALEDVDYAADEMFKRRQGLKFDPWYYQHGDALGGGRFAVEDEVYLEQKWSGKDFEAAATIDFDWQEQSYRIARPARLGDVHFVYVGDVEDGGRSLELVLVRRSSWFQSLKRLARTAPLEVIESEAEPPPEEGLEQIRRTEDR